LSYLIRGSLFLLPILFGGCSFSLFDSTPSTSIYKGRGGGVEEDKVIKDSDAMHRATMKPYQIDGKWYYPSKVSIGDKSDGIASWYGPNFHGKKTSNGEDYSQYKKTAAHKTLPMNTVVKVTNKNNNKSTVVRVNDRGPFVEGRIIDLSYVAGKDIGIDKTGIAPVKVEVLGFQGNINTLQTSPTQKSVELNKFYVQIGAFRNKDGAKRYSSENALVSGRYHAVIKEGILDDAPIYRVWLDGFRGEEEARDFIASGKFEHSFIIGE